jgi:protein TonB
LTGLDAGYRPAEPGARATLLSLIAGLHVAALAAALAHPGVRAVLHEPLPLLVNVIPAPRTRVEIAPPAALPTPKLPLPRIILPDPPPVDITITPPPPPAAAAEAPPSPAPTRAVVAFLAAAEPQPAITPPRGDLAYLDNPAPTYPSASRRAREQGRVLLRVRVSATGKVEAIETQQSSGHERLDEAARAAVRRWRFIPAKRGETPVAAWALVPLTFSLQG